MPGIYKLFCLYVFRISLSVEKQMITFFDELLLEFYRMVLGMSVSTSLPVTICFVLIYLSGSICVSVYMPFLFLSFFSKLSIPIFFILGDLPSAALDAVPTITRVPLNEPRFVFYEAKEMFSAFFITYFT